MFGVLDILFVPVFCYAFYICTNPEMIFGWYARLIDKLPTFLWKPLGGCLICFTGQVSLWYYLVRFWHNYNFLNHLFFITGSIVIVMIIDKLIDYESEDA